MGKSLSNITKQVVNRHHSKRLKPTKQAKPRSRIQRLKMETKSDLDNINDNGSGSGTSNKRVPLSEVVSDCINRWFKDTLKEAKAGDINMQVLVGQMYYSGYGVPKEGRMWMTRASRTRSSVWKVCDKQPGYNASDSDTDELKVDSLSDQ